MGEFKQFCELGETNDAILPDAEVVSNTEPFIGDFAENVYVHGLICEEIRDRAREGKAASILYSKCNEVEFKLKPGEKSSLDRLMRKNREIRNLENGRLDGDSYNLLMTGASVALNREESIALVSNNPLLQEAYLNLMGKNSYLNQMDFSMYSFEKDTSVQKIK